MFNAENWVSLAGLFGSVFAAVWSLAWWLSGKFGEMSKDLRERIASVEKNLTEKLEYHERHDDQRFTGIRNDLWEIRVQNAARDGVVRLKKIKENET